MSGEGGKIIELKRQGLGKTAPTGRGRASRTQEIVRDGAGGREPAGERAAPRGKTATLDGMDDDDVFRRLMGLWEDMDAATRVRLFALSRELLQEQWERER